MKDDTACESKYLSFRIKKLGWVKRSRLVCVFAFLLFFCEVIKMLERDFQSKLIKELKDRLPGCIVLKNDPTYKQGIPDLIVLYEDMWATLECKKNKKASHQANQDYYVKRMDRMSFSSFIYPENKLEVLNDLERFFKMF